MLDTFPMGVLVGAVLGFLSGLGIGGGSLLLLWLTLVIGMEPEAARGINLLFFLPAAAVSCCFRWKQGVLDWKKVIPAVIAGCTGAIISGNLSQLFHPELLKKLFGGILILTSIRELTWKGSAQ